MKMVMLRFFLFLAACCKLAFSLTISIPECEPPDYPEHGGYGPRQDFYVAGDFIHYYCDTDTYIGGNFYRRCEDSGDWTGDAPVCDTPQIFSSVNQTSSADPENQNSADKATDQERSTCSSTRGQPGDMWMGTLSKPGELFRVSIYSPQGAAEYEVFLIKRSGEELSCGKRHRSDNFDWIYHNCPGPHNTDAVALKIVSLSSEPLQLCEVVIHVLTSPTCVDPHVRIENGRLQLNRKTATLVCDSGYSRSPETRLECIRTGVWTRKTLYCLDRQWEVGRRQSASDQEP